MAVPILPLDEMSIEEKLQTMEALWENLSVDPNAIESPAWHEEVLREREGKIASGEANLSTGKRPSLIFFDELREDRPPPRGPGRFTRRVSIL